MASSRVGARTRAQGASVCKGQEKAGLLFRLKAFKFPEVILYVINENYFKQQNKITFQYIHELVQDREDEEWERLCTEGLFIETPILHMLL